MATAGPGANAESNSECWGSSSKGKLGQAGIQIRTRASHLGQNQPAGKPAGALFRAGGYLGDRDWEISCAGPDRFFRLHAASSTALPLLRESPPRCGRDARSPRFPASCAR